MALVTSPYPRSDRHPTIVVKVADSLERFLALGLRGMIYLEELGQHGIDLADRHAIHLIAVRERNVMAALRLLGPGPLPLEVAEFMAMGRDSGRVMQVGRFWIRKDMRRITAESAPLFGALRIAMLATAKRLAAREILLRTPVQDVDALYRSVGFERVQELDFHDPVWGDVYVMRLVVDESPSGGNEARVGRQSASASPTWAGRSGRFK